MELKKYAAKAKMTVSGVAVTINYAGVVDVALNPKRPTLVLLHGHSSSLNEHDDVLPFLTPHANVFTFDQPNCGKSSDVPVSKLMAKYGKGATRHFEALYFLRDVIDAFVRGVVLPKIATPTVTIAGGSLGGNLSLLIAERQPRYGWLGKAAAWSPGSGWAASLEKSIGSGPARERAKADWKDKRDEFLRMTFVDLTVPHVAATLVGKTAFPQPWYWFWDCWDAPSTHDPFTPPASCAKCVAKPSIKNPDGSLFAQTDDSYPKMSQRKADAIQASFLALYHAFTPPRASWHWELAAEQVEFSHRQLVQVDGARKPRCAFITVPMLLLAGEEDRFWPAGLHDETRNTYLTAKQHGAPVDWLSVQKSGHSIHNERPADLAGWLREL